MFSSALIYQIIVLVVFLVFIILTAKRSYPVSKKNSKTTGNWKIGICAQYCSMMLSRYIFAQVGNITISSMMKKYAE